MVCGTGEPHKPEARFLMIGAWANGMVPIKESELRKNGSTHLSPKEKTFAKVLTLSLLDTEGGHDLPGETCHLLFELSSGRAHGKAYHDIF